MTEIQTSARSTKSKSSYSIKEYTDMVITYGMAGESAGAAAQLYAECFPGRDKFPSKFVISNCVRRFKETGSVAHIRLDIGRSKRLSVRKEEQILRNLQIILELVCAAQPVY